MDGIIYVVKRIDEGGSMEDKHKVRVRKDGDGYQKWLDAKDGYDSASLERIGEASSPFAMGLVPPLLDDAYEVLEKLYYNGEFKGRQKQIVGLLFEGFISQTDIAKLLNMRQSNVAVELRKIMKKITKTII